MLSDEFIFIFILLYSHYIFNCSFLLILDLMGFISLYQMLSIMLPINYYHVSKFWSVTTYAAINAQLHFFSEMRSMILKYWKFITQKAFLWCKVNLNDITLISKSAYAGRHSQWDRQVAPSPPPPVFISRHILIFIMSTMMRSLSQHNGKRFQKEVGTMAGAKNVWRKGKKLISLFNGKIHKTPSVRCAN